LWGKAVRLKEDMSARNESFSGRNRRADAALRAVEGLRDRLGGQLRHLRRERKLTQEALAERSELSVDTVRRVERGTFSPSLETLARLAAGLDVSLHALIGRVDGVQLTPEADLCDYLATRSRREVRIARRVVHSLCDALTTENS
jgi:transcriptional regulator with XRE-family HTH domain